MAVAYYWKEFRKSTSKTIYLLCVYEAKRLGDDYTGVDACKVVNAYKVVDTYKFGAVYKVSDT